MTNKSSNTKYINMIMLLIQSLHCMLQVIAYLVLAINFSVIGCVGLLGSIIPGLIVDPYLFRRFLQDYYGKTDEYYSKVRYKAVIDIVSRG